MMNLLDPDIPLDYLLPMSLPYAKTYKFGVPQPQSYRSNHIGHTIKAISYSRTQI